jgi:uncharacterized membrane protein (UPF0127 family)
VSIPRARRPLRARILGLSVGLGGLLAIALVVAGATSGHESSPERPPSISPAVDALPAGVVSFHPPSRPGGADPTPSRVMVRIADTPETRSRGLQGVELLPDGAGLLFHFPEPEGPGGRGGFWMLDTRIPLDIVFAQAGRVVGTASMLPCPGPPCPVTHPGVGYDLAVELPAGWLARTGVSTDWSVTWERAARMAAAPARR